MSRLTASESVAGESEADSAGALEPAVEVDADVAASAVVVVALVHV